MPPERTPVRAPGAGRPAPPATVLVVDEDAATRAGLVGELSREYRVFEAGSGAAALQLLACQPVDVVLLDVTRSSMDGFEVCRRVKEQAGTAYLPVLLLTAANQGDEGRWGLAAGADDLLTKPVLTRELLLRVATFARIRAQEALIRAQLAELTRIQALKDDLVSLVLHDVRNPLNAIGLDVHFVRQYARREGIAHVAAAAERITEATHRLNDLLADVLHVRSLESGEMPIDRGSVRLGELVAQAVCFLEGAARDADVRIETHVAASDETVWLDARLVRRAIENVLANALKYSPAGESISIVARLRDDLEIEIADRGPGVPDQLKEKIFEKFGSVEAERLSTRRGYGLGLYLVNLVTARHGGCAQVRDREGGGSVFRLRFAEVAVPAVGLRADTG